MQPPDTLLARYLTHRLSKFYQNLGAFGHRDELFRFESRSSKVKVTAKFSGEGIMINGIEDHLVRANSDSGCFREVGELVKAVTRSVLRLLFYNNNNNSICIAP